MKFAVALIATVSASRLNTETQVEDELEHFGHICSGELEDLIADCDFIDHAPKLDADKNEILFHPSYAKAGALIWQSGILSDALKENHTPKQALLFYLLAHQGEGPRVRRRRPQRRVQRRWCPPHRRRRSSSVEAPLQQCEWR